ncbi:hypothetical protein ACPV6D_05090 [Corynebacterium propinquum]|uniref:hypothetical protein n=1 Tax=Corynebacterium propinquum TaxID=43769 RepID=UPI003C9E38EC
MRRNNFDAQSDWLAPVGLMVAAFALFGLLPLVVAVQVGLAFGFGVGLAMFFVEFSVLFLVVFPLLNRMILQSCK